MNQPRTKDGRALHLMEGESYAVAIDQYSQEELGPRVPGTLWFSVAGGRGIANMTLVFFPDELDTRHRATIPVETYGRVTTVGLFFKGTWMMNIDMLAVPMTPGMTISVDWGTTAEAIA